MDVAVHVIRSRNGPPAAVQKGRRCDQLLLLLGADPKTSFCCSLPTLIGKWRILGMQGGGSESQSQRLDIVHNYGGNAMNFVGFNPMTVSSHIIIVSCHQHNIEKWLIWNLSFFFDCYFVKNWENIQSFLSKTFKIPLSKCSYFLDRSNCKKSSFFDAFKIPSKKTSLVPNGDL